ncbi:cyclic GMP-AMP synthase [Molossus nigricans]
MDPQRRNATKAGSKAGAATAKVSARGANGAKRKPSAVETTRTKPSASGPQERPQVRARGARTEKVPLSAEDRQAALAEGPEPPAFRGPPLPRAGSRREGGARAKKAPLCSEDSEDRQDRPAALAERPEPPAFRGPPLPRAGSRREGGARAKKAPLSAEDTEDRQDRQAALAEGPEPPAARRPTLPRAGSRREGNARSGAQRRPLSRPTEVPDHVLLVPAPSLCLRQPAPGAWKPRAVLEKLKLRTSEISNASKAVNNVVDHLQRRLQSSQSEFKGVSLLGSGSYYERVKVSAPNEFDVMFQLDTPRIQLEEYHNSGAHYFVKFKRNPRGHPLNEFLEDGVLSASKMLSKFRKIIKEEVKNIADVSVEKKKKGCPAVTLLISKPKEISVDIILALKVKSSWPASTQEGLPIRNWLGAKVRKNLRQQPFYLVPKFAKEGNRFQENTWRLSFSHIEKNILENHGKAKTCCECDGVKCCRKDCLKLMKYLLEQLKEKFGNPKELTKFFSYQLKTAFFHLCAENPDDSDWQSKELELCFDRCVQYFLQCLEKEYLEHFFIPGVNFFSRDKIDRISKEFLLKEIEYERNNGYPIFENTWRLSFSHIEKNILQNHGKAKTCCECDGVKCCRKDCLKLMKYLLEQLKEKFGNQKELSKFFSYQLKTAFFHLCAENPQDSEWQSKDLELCFDRCVQYFLQCLEKEYLEHFFIPGFNFFSRDKINRKSKEFMFKKIEYERSNGYPIFVEF